MENTIEIVTKVDTENANIDKANANIDKAITKFKKLLCPFDKNGLNTVLHGQGCDGINQNCDGIVDECAEDLTPPMITLNRSLFPLPIFQSMTDAIAFIDRNLIVSDDCTSRDQLTITIQLVPEQSNPFNFQVQVTISDNR